MQDTSSASSREKGGGEKVVEQEEEEEEGLLVFVFVEVLVLPSTSPARHGPGGNV